MGERKAKESLIFGVQNAGGIAQQNTILHKNSHTKGTGVILLSIHLYKLCISAILIGPLCKHQ